MDVSDVHCDVALWMELTQYSYQWRTSVLAMLDVESPGSKLSGLHMNTVLYI
jgi:hypothetical protein